MMRKNDFQKRKKKWNRCLIGIFRRFYRFEHLNFPRKHQHAEDSFEGKHEHAYFHRVEFFSKKHIESNGSMLCPLTIEREITKWVCSNWNSTPTRKHFSTQNCTYAHWMPAMNVTTIATNERREKSQFISNNILYLMPEQSIETLHNIRFEWINTPYTYTHTGGNKQRYTTTTTTTNNWIWFHWILKMLYHTYSYRNGMKWNW